MSDAALPLLDHRVVAVTGASRGIGRAIAELLHRSGARVLAVRARAAGLSPRGLRLSACAGG